MERVVSKKGVDWTECVSDKTDSASPNRAVIRLYTYDWTVNDYSFIKCFSSGAISPDFRVGQGDAEIMKLRLLPCSDPNNLNIEVSLHRLQTSDSSELFAKNISFAEAAVKLEFLDFNGKILDYFSVLPDLKSLELASTDSKSNPKFCRWKREENVSKFVEKDTLKLRAKLSLRYFPILEKDEPLHSKSVEGLSKDMKKLIGGNLFPDLTIKVAGQCYFLHKCILLPQFEYVTKLGSELLKYIPSTEELTSKASSVKFRDTTVCLPNENTEVFKSILHYLYTGKIAFANTLNDFDLYEFAQKYQLHELGRHLRPDEMHLRTQTEKFQVGFYWHMKEYSARSLEKFNLFKSPVYKSCIGNNDISWCVSLFIFDVESIFLSLQRVEGFDIDVQTAFRLIVCKPDGTPYKERDFEHYFESKVPSSYPGFLDSESRFTISPNLLFDDTLIIRCDITVSDGQLKPFTSRIYSGEPTKFDFKMWLKNLQNLLETGNFSDVSLLVDGTEFKVHKAILSTRSPVFEKMFETNMTEKINNSVKIDDISSATMKCALTYIYTGTLDILTISEAPELYRTADKYEILELKERCAEFILDNLDAEHACEVLILSDLFDEEKMKKTAKDIICRNASLSLLTDYGQEVMFGHPNLAHDLLDTLSAVYCSLPPQNVYANGENDLISIKTDNDSKLKDT